MAGADAPSLALLVDTDAAVRRETVPLVSLHGLELIQARSTIAALELLQRLPRHFRLVVVSMDLPGLPGAVLLEALRLFRPGIATLCLSSAAVAGANCLIKPVRTDELRSQIAEALTGTTSARAMVAIGADVVRRARSCFAESGSLLEAARELAHGLPSEPTV